MRFRDSLAVNVCPIVLRLVLGVTFLWAGYGKVFTVAPFTPEQIAFLDLMDDGDDDDGTSAEPPIEAIEPGATDADEDAQQPETPTPEAPLPEPDQTDTEGDADGGSIVLVPAVLTGASAFRVIPAQDAVEDDDDSTFVATERRKVNFLAMMIKGAATPDEHGAALLPEYFGQGKWPIRLAWMAGLTELLGGTFMVLGFLTRISALGLGFTMLTALWMTSIGPVIVFDAPSSFFFLPALNDFAVGAWQTWLWQFALLGISTSLLLAGPGALSADRFLLSRRASKRAKPRPKPQPAHDDN